MQKQGSCEWHFVRRYDKLWEGLPRRYGSKSTVHRSHLYLCEHGIYEKIFNELLNKGYDLRKINLSHCFTDAKDIPAENDSQIK